MAIINGRLSERSFRGYRRFRPLVAPAAGQSRSDRRAERAVRRAVSGTRRAERQRCTSPARSSSTARRPIATIPPRVRLRQAGRHSRRATSSFWPAARRSPRSGWPWTRSASCRRRIRDLRLILVPRHPERFDEVAALLAASGLPWQRRSAAGHRAARSATPACCWSIASASWAPGGARRTIAFVGGSMGKRDGQNMIEPAAYGAAVSFGPTRAIFATSSRPCLAGEAAVVVHDGAELTAFVRRCLDDPPFAAELGRAGPAGRGLATGRHRAHGRSARRAAGTPTAAHAIARPPDRRSDAVCRRRRPSRGSIACRFRPRLR